MLISPSPHEFYKRFCKYSEGSNLSQWRHPPLKLSTVQCTIQHIRNTAYSTLQTAYCLLHTAQKAPFTEHCTLHTAHTKPHTAYTTLKTNLCTKHTKNCYCTLHRHFNILMAHFSPWPSGCGGRSASCLTSIQDILQFLSSYGFLCQPFGIFRIVSFLLTPQGRLGKVL